MPGASLQAKASGSPAGSLALMARTAPASRGRGSASLAAALAARATAVSRAAAGTSAQLALAARGMTAAASRGVIAAAASMVAVMATGAFSLTGRARLVLVHPRRFIGRATRALFQGDARRRR